MVLIFSRISLMSCSFWKTVCTDTPPVKSMSNKPCPRTTAITSPSTVMSTEKVAQAGNQAMKSIFVWPIHCIMFSLL